MPIFINSGRFGSTSVDPATLTWTAMYDFSNAGSVTTATGISQLDDLSGNANHVVQGTGASQPAYDLAAQNGLNVGTFDGSNDYLATSGTVTQSRPAMLFVVAKWTGAAASTNADVFAIGTTGRFLLRKVATTDVWQAANPSGVSSPGAADNNWHVFTALFNSTSSYLMIDGVQVASGDTGTGSATLALQIGAIAGSRPFPGQIGFVGIGGTQTDANRDGVIAFLRSKWAI